MEAHLELPNESLFVGAAAAFASDLAGRLGFGSEDVETIRAAVDEACAYVLERSEGESLSYSVTLKPTSRGLVIKVRDQALPVDPEHPVEGTSEVLKLRLMQAYVDEVRFFNRGRGGNEVRLVKRFKGPFRGLTAAPPRQGEAPIERLVVRLVRPEEAVGVSRCIYRAYGYTYTGEESVYRPEWVTQMSERGDLISAVSVTPRGEVVGHAALMRTEDQELYELGLAAVAPGFRGQGLFARMADVLLDEADNRDIRALMSEPVCSHPYSQKAMLAFGFVECGLSLACIPAEESVKGQAPSQGRVSLVEMVRLRESQSRRVVYLPADYRAMAEEIVARVGQKRYFEEPGPIDDERQLWWDIHPPMKRAVIRLKGPVTSDLNEALRALLGEGIAVLWAQLDPADPATPGNIEQLNQHGFFFAAFIPGPSHDLLRMQYLNHVRADRLVLASDWGQQLAEFVQADAHRRE